MTKKILFLIIALGFLVRIVNFNYPPLLWDEASLGYNAYSILKTARDEYGQFLPYIFKSFGDFKPGAYVYLTLPFVATLGLNPIAVRLPSVILGSLLPLLFYLLVLKLSPKSKRLGLLAAALIAFNPWNIHYSRGAWETNILLFELVLGSYLFLSQNYFKSALIFGLTFYTYQGGKIMTPLLLFILFILQFKKISLPKFSLRFVLPLFILALPILYGLVAQSDANRLKVFSLWSYTRPQTDITQITSESSQLDYSLFHNGFIFFVRNFSERYFNHLSPRFLTFQGDWQIGRQSAPYVGVLLYPSLILIIIGLIYSLSKTFTPATIFFFYWLIIGPLPSALTRDIIQPVRSLSLTIPLLYFAAVGLEYLLLKFPQLIFKAFIFIIFLLSFIYWSDMYFNHMVKVNPDHWLYGYQPAMTYAIQHQSGNNVVFTDFYGQPYIYYLFLSQFSPSEYQSQANLISSGLDTGKIAKINNFTFTTPDFRSLSQKPTTLMILSYDDILRQGIDLSLFTPLSPINGHSSFYAYQTN